MAGSKLNPDLQKEIGGAGPEALAALSAAEQTRLLKMLRAAKQSQKDALKAAIDEGMSFVPALLRIPLKRILFP